jgi:broad specificity phosphatase PhoE
MPDRNSPTRFGLIRHAQTVWNLDKMIQGQKDSSLTTTGRAQSLNWGERLAPLPFDRILTSDLCRTVATAELINRTLRLPMKKTAQLRELDWGAWTGRRIRDIEKEIPEELRSMEQAGWQFRPPGGESRRAVWLRSRGALEDASKRWPGETILTVTHKGVIKCLLYGLAERKYLPQEPAMIKPRHLHWIADGETGLAIERVNAIEL